MIQTLQDFMITRLPWHGIRHKPTFTHSTSHSCTMCSRKSEWRAHELRVLCLLAAETYSSVPNKNNNIQSSEQKRGMAEKSYVAAAMPTGQADESPADENSADESRRASSCDRQRPQDHAPLVEREAKGIKEENRSPPTSSLSSPSHSHSQPHLQRHHTHNPHREDHNRPLPKFPQ